MRKPKRPARATWASKGKTSALRRKRPAKDCWDFQEQLKKGEEGERKLQRIYHGKALTKAKTRDYDFNRADGAKVEVKSDSYDPTKTACFFFERYSDVAKKKPGSVWQSREKGATVLVYFFVNHGIYFEFPDLHLLEVALDVLIRAAGLKPIEIRNKGWTALGYRVPRDALVGLFKEYRVKDGDEKASLIRRRK